MDFYIFFPIGKWKMMLLQFSSYHLQGTMNPALISPIGPWGPLGTN